MVVPCEIVANVLVAQYCVLFMHSELYWFEFNIIVKAISVHCNMHSTTVFMHIFLQTQTDLYNTFLALYVVGIVLGSLKSQM